MKDIVEYYYMWKTTDRYVQQKRAKAAEGESRLKQVYIPNYNKPNPNLVGPANPSAAPVQGQKPCESCSVCSYCYQGLQVSAPRSLENLVICSAMLQAEASPLWYAWGPPHLQYRLCGPCWNYWKKFGGLKRSHHDDAYDKIGQVPSSRQLDIGGVQQTASHRGLMPQQSSQSRIHPPAPSVATISRAPVASALHHTQHPVHPVGPQRAHNGPMSNRQQMGGSSARYAAFLANIISPNLLLSDTDSVYVIYICCYRTAFYLRTTAITRIARRLAPKVIYSSRRSARKPFIAINGHGVKQHCWLPFACFSRQLLQ